MVSQSFAKSTTKVRLPGIEQVRFRRLRVCTAATPVSILSTYIAQSFGWSKPVWNLFAHTMMRFSSVSKSSAVRVSATPFTLASVTSSPSTSFMKCSTIICALLPIIAGFQSTMPMRARLAFISLYFGSSAMVFTSLK